MQLYEKPVPENDFVRHCVQRRKYPVLLKVSTRVVVAVLVHQPTAVVRPSKVARAADMLTYDQENFVVKYCSSF